MDFGEKFRAEHPSLNELMNKSELDAYAEKIKSKINETDFDEEHDTVSLKNSILTQKQIDYLQLKLNVYISRLDNETITIYPFKSCNVHVEFNIWALLVITIVLSALTIFPFELCMNFFSTLDDSPFSLFIIFCCTVPLIIVPLAIGILIYMAVQKFRNKRYIARLKESSKI